MFSITCFLPTIMAPIMCVFQHDNALFFTQQTNDVSFGTILCGDYTLK